MEILSRNWYLIGYLIIFVVNVLTLFNTPLANDSLVDLDYYYFIANNLFNVNEFAIFDPYIYNGQAYPAHYVVRFASSFDSILTYISSWTNKINFSYIFLISRGIEYLLLGIGILCIGRQRNLKRYESLIVVILVTYSISIARQTWPLGIALHLIWLEYFYYEIISNENINSRKLNHAIIIFLLIIARVVFNTYPAGILLMLTWFAIKLISGLEKIKYLVSGNFKLIFFPFIIIIILFPYGYSLYEDSNVFNYYNRKEKSYYSNNIEAQKDVIKKNEVFNKSIDLSEYVKVHFNVGNINMYNSTTKYFLYDANIYVPITALIMGLIAIIASKQYATLALCLVYLLFGFCPTLIFHFASSNVFIFNLLNFRYFSFGILLAKMYFLLNAASVFNFITFKRRVIYLILISIVLLFCVSNSYVHLLALIGILILIITNNKKYIKHALFCMVLLEVIIFSISSTLPERNFGQYEAEQFVYKDHKKLDEYEFRSFEFIKNREVNYIYPKLPIQVSSKMKTLPYPLIDIEENTKKITKVNNANWRTLFINKCYDKLISAESYIENLEIDKIKNPVFSSGKIKLTEEIKPKNFSANIMEFELNNSMNLKELNIDMAYDIKKVKVYINGLLQEDIVQSEHCGIRVNLNNANNQIRVVYNNLNMKIAAWISFWVTLILVVSIYIYIFHRFTLFKMHTKLASHSP